MSETQRRTQTDRRKETRRALLDSAAQLFAERGYHAVSMDEIAAHAGYTRGALHYNFGGKHELLLALLDERAIVRSVVLDSTEPTPAALARELPFDREFNLLFLEFAAEAARNPEIGAALLDRLASTRRENVPAVQRMLDDLSATTTDAEDLLAIAGAVLNGLAIEALAGEDLDGVNRRFELFLRLMIAGLRAQ